MRTLATCIAMLLAISVTAAFAAPAQPDRATEAQSASPPPAPGRGVGSPGNVVTTEGSHLDLRLYLSIPELFQVLSRVGAIPREVAEQALAASREAAPQAEASPSYVRVEVHMRMAEVAPLLAAMAQAQRAAATPTPAPKGPAAAAAPSAQKADSEPEQAPATKK